MRDGKPSDAISLLEEVLKADDTSYGDHFLMARASDKLGRSAEALRHYRRVMELTSSSPRDAEERTARQESDKRIKALDPLADKIGASTDEFVRKLDTLEREAISIRSLSALERLFRLRGAIWAAERRKDVLFFEVKADAEWQETAFRAVAGQKYRVRAAGIWRIKGDVSCTAGGTAAKPGNRFGKMGQLLAFVSGEAYPLGEDATFVPTGSGPLLFICNEEEQQSRKNYSGTVQVLLEPAR